MGGQVVADLVVVVLNRPGFLGGSDLREDGVMGSPTRYPPEVRESAVRMVFSQEAEHDSQWAAICSISTKLGMTVDGG